MDKTGTENPFVVYEEQKIEAEPIRTEEKVDKTKINGTVTHASNSIIESKSSPEDPPLANSSPIRRIFSSCCCSCKEEKFANLEMAGTTADYEDQANSVQKSRSFLSELRSFLDSAIYYIFVIVLTLANTIILFIELFFDSGLIQIPDGPQKDHVAPGLHWFSFSILSLFSIEMMFRIVIWRTDIVKDLVQVIDCAIIFIAFVANLCATLVAGAQTPIDSISLIIILRLIRIQSIIRVKVKAIKEKNLTSSKEFEEKLRVANNTISDMRRQILDKDFEIRQLHAHLSGVAMDDPQFNALSKTSRVNDVGKGATADSDLEIAIALSKQTFNEESNGHVNKAFTPLPKEDDAFRREYAVLVHPKPSRAERQSLDLEPENQTPSFIDDFFTKRDEAIKDGISPGARRKTNISDQSFELNSNNHNNKGQDVTVQELPLLNMIDTSSSVQKSPVTILIDPNILICTEDNDSKSFGEFEYLAESENNQSQVESCDDLIDDEMKNNPGTQVPHPGESVQSSDAGSSDEYNSDSRSLKHLPEVKCKMAAAILNKHSGSSLGSESGYHSEELTQNGTNRKIFKTVKGASVHSDDMAKQSVEMDSL